MTKELYNVINGFIRERALSIKEDESKNSEQIGFPISNYIDYSPQIDNPKYCCIATNTFKSIIVDNNTLSVIATKKPELFGTGNAKDVLKGILLNNPNYQCTWNDDVDRFAVFLAKRAYLYAMKVDNNEVNNDVLRIDLFRELKTSKEDEGKFDFIGGLLHSFKHFSISGISLSTGNCEAELYHTLRIINYSLKAFFEGERVEIENGFKSYVPFDKNYKLCFIFYHNKRTNTFYINTIIKKEK
ncbi:hypothetical protein EHW67_09480 [Arenibacter aquaticus]|uniref:Uncharacterized protein n=1 Tax=Arenibacter aquaticus TaxID=2489054 RepID=A0A3S0CLK8_9FLAO|nr:hypothetical protein [Arenibacter aquaticus]RTE54143.1 hypothetical protein EHW67_09480 [Arenibacter aquaticus]